MQSNIFSSVSRFDIFGCEWKIHVSSAKRWNVSIGDESFYNYWWCCLYTGEIARALGHSPAVLYTPHVTVSGFEIYFSILTLWVLFIR